MTERTLRRLRCTIGVLVLTVLVLAATQWPMGFDEGIWLYVARAWVEDGHPPYRGTVENKTPGIFYLFTLSYLVAGPSHVPPRLAGIAALLGFSLVCGALGRRLGGPLAGLATALVAGLAMSARAVDGPDTSSTESFMVLFSTAAVAAAVAAAGRRPGASRARGMLWAGVWLGTAIAFKQVAVATAPALLGFAWSLTPTGTRTAGRSVRDASWMALGAGAVTMASLVPLVLAGVSPAEYVEGAWLILTRRGSRVPGTVSERVAALPPLWAQPPFPFLVVAVLAFFALRRRLRDRAVPWGAIALWTALEAAGGLGSGSYFPHQLKQIVPPMAVAAGLGLDELGRLVARRGVGPRRVAALVLGLAGLVFLPHATVMGHPAGAPTATGRMIHLSAGRFIRASTRPDEYVFTWVGGGLVQITTRRRSPARHFNRNFGETAAAAREILDAFEARPPRFIAVERRAPAWLAAYIADCCDLAQERGGGLLLVFERRPEP